MPTQIKYVSGSVEVACSTIAPALFQYCLRLQTVIIKGNVTAIGAQIFYYCSHVTSINVPASVTVIGESAFERCNLLKTIMLEEGPQTIERNETNVRS